MCKWCFIDIKCKKLRQELGTYEDRLAGTITYDFVLTQVNFLNPIPIGLMVFYFLGIIPPGGRVVRSVSGERNTQHGFRKWIFIDSSMHSFDLPGPGFYVDDE
ncbi:MAG: hypothetical protein IPQ02_11540 [Saprospiraceae bacterium]|nr:hypothetical protein [Candidatus Defluviibacterium haderslevense]